MADLYLGIGDHDIAIALNGMRLTSGLLETAAQRLRIKLETFLGEWFLDTQVGVPYYRDILLKNPDLSIIRGLFRKILLDDPDVDSVPRLDLELDASRLLKVEFDAVLVDRSIASVSLPAEAPLPSPSPPPSGDAFPILF